MRFLGALLLVFLQFQLNITFVAANTEKVIFVHSSYSPEDAEIITASEDRFLTPPLRLSPAAPRMTVTLNTAFVPKQSKNKLPVQDDSPDQIEKNVDLRELGYEAWVALDSLNPEQRYEVRICWPATSPSSFDMHIHSAPEILRSKTLYEHLFNATHNQLQHSDAPPSQYLQIFARADYFTLDKERMEYPDQVEVEIVLDPYVYNVLPQSLIPIVGVIVVVSLCAWSLSGGIISWMASVISAHAKENAKKNV